jgi:uncharacterized protein (TIGR01370 family)
MAGRAVWRIAIAILLLTACSGRGAPSAPDGTASGTARRPPRSFALALGVDVDDAGVIERLGGYDLVVVDGQGTSAAAVRRLHDGGATVLAYLSVGTVEPGRPWFATARDQGWLLEHWDDWDEWYAAVAESGLRDLLVTEADSELAKGFDGLFLDNTDMVQTHPAQRSGMVRLVAALDQAVGDDGLLFAQNGDPGEAGIVSYLDGWNREDVSFTYDFEREAYVPVGTADHREAMHQLTEYHDAGLIVTATDYLERPDAHAEDQAADAACSTGALPNVSDLDLTRIADPALTCAGR